LPIKCKFLKTLFLASSGRNGGGVEIDSSAGVDYIAESISPQEIDSSEPIPLAIKVKKKRPLIARINSDRN